MPLRIIRGLARHCEASILIAHHHERWDGSGYPYGIRGKFIPLGARILSVADAFDAIKVPHVYDCALRNVIALRMLRISSGTQFDPSVVEALAKAMASQAADETLRSVH